MGYTVVCWRLLLLGTTLVPCISLNSPCRPAPVQHLPHMRRWPAPTAELGRLRREERLARARGDQNRGSWSQMKPLCETRGMPNPAVLMHICDFYSPSLEVPTLVYNYSIGFISSVHP